MTITNRSPNRANALGEEFGCAVIEWEQRGEQVCDILVNCTSVGMHPNVTESPFDLPWLNESMLVFDTVYMPENTQLLEHAKTRGCATASGLEMFRASGNPSVRTIRRSAGTSGIYDGNSSTIVVDLFPMTSIVVVPFPTI